VEEGDQKERDNRIPITRNEMKKGSQIRRGRFKGFTGEGGHLETLAVGLKKGDQEKMGM